ncbi:carbohydrate-binding family 9-like protein [Flagellimonas olearia]|nr:carbohydrate-binding family 9-like protein [Allomuricauda olearia]
MCNKLMLFLFLPMLFGCSPEEVDNVYEVAKREVPIEIDGDWSKDAWRDVQPLQLENHMGEYPEHMPKVQVKVMYDEEAIYVIYKVDDQYVRCVLEEYQDPVSQDSTVEFFFTPGQDIQKGYFNLEMNCGGTGLFKFQEKARKGQLKIPKESFDHITAAHSLPKKVYPEIKEPVTWTLEYRIPFDVLSTYFDEMEYPAPGVEWKANFYKIADKSSHPHWLTWSYVDNPKPQFHLPEFFGTLRFR